MQLRPGSFGKGKLPTETFSISKRRCCRLCSRPVEPLLGFVECGCEDLCGSEPANVHSSNLPLRGFTLGASQMVFLRRLGLGAVCVSPFALWSPDSFRFGLAAIRGEEDIQATLPEDADLTRGDNARPATHHSQLCR